MALVDMRDMLRHAYEHGYAVAAFEIVSLDVLAAVLDAAERCRAPALIIVGDDDDAPCDLDVLMPAAETAARRASVPVAIQYAPVNSLDDVYRAMALGCNGIAMSRRRETFPEAIKKTREIVDWAHGCGMPVEAGWLSAPPMVAADEALAEEEDAWPTPSEATAFVQRAGVDFLALDDPRSVKTKIDFPRLKLIGTAVRTPLVLHGAGALNEDQIRRAIFKGVAKISVDPATLQGRDTSSRPSAARTRRADMGVEAERHMRLYGSAGRAAEVLSRCAPWTVVQQVWLCGGDAVDEGAFAGLMDECRRLVGTTPGVRGVFAGRASAEHERYRYCIVFRLSHPDAANHAHDALSTVRRSFSERCVAVDVPALEIVA